jgi:hypothetical protein
MTHSTVASAASDTDCAENTTPLLFTGRCLVTAGCFNFTILALSEYDLKIFNEITLILIFTKAGQ